MPIDGVYVIGLAQLRRDLRKLGEAEELGEVRGALRKAADIVAADARRRVPVRTGTARSSVRALVSGNRAFVAGGKKRVPYYGWLDFGSRRPISGRSRSVGPWRGSGEGPTKGRFIYPAIDARMPDVAKFVGDAIDSIARRNNL